MEEEDTANCHPQFHFFASLVELYQVHTEHAFKVDVPQMLELERMSVAKSVSVASKFKVWFAIAKVT